MVWIITFNRKFKFQRDKFLLQLAQRKVQKGKLLCSVMKKKANRHCISALKKCLFDDFMNTSLPHPVFSCMTR